MRRPPAPHSGLGALVDETAARATAVRGPWSSDHLVRALLGNGLGGLLIATAWFQAAIADTDAVRTRMTWLVLAIVGLVVAGVSNALWLFRGRQALTIARVALMADMREGLRPAPEGDGPRHRAVERFVSAPGMTRYHRPTCSLAIGKELTARTAAAWSRAGMSPCEVCEP